LDRSRQQQDTSGVNQREKCSDATPDKYYRIAKPDVSIWTMVTRGKMQEVSKQEDIAQRCDA